MNLICLGVKFLYTLNKDKDHKIFILMLCLYSTKQRKGAGNEQVRKKRTIEKRGPLW